LYNSSIYSLHLIKSVTTEFLLVLSFTSFEQNFSNIYISKLVFYENIFNDLSNDTNYVL